MFGKLYDKAFESVMKMRIDSIFYGAVLDELENGFRDKQHWGEAIVKSKGNKEKAESYYVERRALSMQAHYDIQLDGGIEDKSEFIELLKSLKEPAKSK
ncbi:MAG: hypothetical protein ACI9L9_000385 [Marivirga sp.]|jgi:hypothetical protein